MTTRFRDKPSAVLEDGELRIVSVRPNMRDGTRLEGDLYLPVADEPLPTLLRKTPYERTWDMELDKRLARSGYAVLVVNQRGRFGSEGTFNQFRNEFTDHADGYDTIEWAARQPWSNGSVGTYGISSDGQWQLSAAISRPPSLRAMVVSYAADARLVRTDRGAFVGTGPAWASMFDGLARRLSSREDWNEWLAAWRASRLPLLMSFIHPDFLEGFMRLDDDTYWEGVDASRHFDRVNVPVLHESGWFDPYLRSTIRNFRQMRVGARRPAARAGQRLLIGPWTHGGGRPEGAELIGIGQTAEIDRAEMHRQWFDYWLRGVNADEPPTGAPVRIYVSGVDGWISGDTWPVADPTTRRWYLGHGSEASTDSLNNGVLTIDRPKDDAPPEVLEHDPYDPVPSIGGYGGLGRQLPAGPLDQRPAEMRSLTYTGPILEEHTAVIGSVEVQLFAACSASDADVVVTLSDVLPDGTSAILRQNALRASRRNESAGSEPLTPGQVYDLRLTLDPFAHVFRIGHRIRLRVSASSFPAYLPNPGSLGAIAEICDAVESRILIYCDAQRSSFIELPVLDEADERLGW